jgi:hypothetical protein
MSNMVPVGTTSFGGGGGDQSSFRARTFLEGQRWADLDRRFSYFECTQHNFKKYDFDGRLIMPSGTNFNVTQPLLGAQQPAFYIPLRQRRPSSPYRLPRVIVKAFTTMLFGEGRFPRFHVEGDSDTEDYSHALQKALKLPTKMIRARNLGGACGAVGLSWGFLEGRPRCQVHNARDLFVHEWQDREECIPRHVTELYKSEKEEWDGSKRRYVTNIYLNRRDWTPNVDIVFQPMKLEAGKDQTNWTPDLAKSSKHDDGEIHFTWIQNQPDSNPDSVPDYEGLYENFDTLDVILSVIVRGATLNLDPTLVLKMDPDMINAMGVRKGSENALVVGEEGDAMYMELDGKSIDAGISLFNAKRKAILEVAQCVLPNPDEITANGTSSVAMKLLYQPMLGQLDVLREQYADGMTRMLSAMIAIARATTRGTITIFNEQNEPQEVQRQILLPQKVTEEDKLDDEGTPTGEKTTKKEDRNPGDGEDIEAQWGPYFPPTPNDQSVTATTLATATGNQPFMSTQTATEIAMQMFNRRPQDELQRVQQEKDANDAKNAQMMPPGAMGGAVGGPSQLPPGAKPKPGKPGKPPPGAGAGPKKGATGTGTDSSAPGSGKPPEFGQ